MPLYGQIGAGASDALWQILTEQVRQQLAQEEMRQRQARLNEEARQFDESLSLRRQQLSGEDKDRELRVRALDQGDAERRDRNNRAGVEEMLQQYALNNPPPPKRTVVTTIGKRGEPVKKAFTEDELAQGVPEYQEPKAPRDERLVQIMGPQGTPIWVNESEARGKPAAQAPRAVTGQERQSLSYYNRAKQASDDIADMEEGMAKGGLMAQVQQQYAPNVLQTEGQQRYRQAQRAFTEARLRKESGAAIPTAEYENDARTYFAQPGDTPQVMAQKRKARQVVLDGLKFSSGKAFNEFYGDEAPAGTGGGGGAQFRFNPATGRIEPVRP